MSGIERIAVQPIDLGLVREIPQASAKQPIGGNFDLVMNQFHDDVNEIAQRSSQLQSQALKAAVQDIHEVILAAEKAGIAFEMIVALRNKLLEAYQELMQIQG